MALLEYGIDPLGDQHQPMWVRRMWAGRSAQPRGMLPPDPGDHLVFEDLARHRNHVGYTRAPTAAAAMAPRSVSRSKPPSCRRPLMKNVGVPFTPLRTPLRKSARTLAVCTPFSSSSAKRRRSRPSALAYASK